MQVSRLSLQTTITLLLDIFSNILLTDENEENYEI